MIRAIAAIDDKQGIGRQGETPWHIPDELQYFKAQTLKHIVVMGRVTCESLQGPLPERRNVVVSRSLQIAPAGFELIRDVDSFLQQITEDVWIIGGAQLYEATLHYCDELYLTKVTGDFDCDRFFPEYSTQFVLREESETKFQSNYSYRTAVYSRT